MYLLILALITIACSSQDLPEVSVDDFRQEWFTQQVDHYSYIDRRKYQQRYWINDKYWDQASGPVFIYICGEYTCSVPETRLYPFMVGAENNALLMVIEHRYYGQSQLFDTWETSTLKYLSAEQALSDLAYFIHSFNNGTPHKWVVIGGSYPGALSAWFRARYPHLAVASWSSSGVVQPIVDFRQYDKQIYDSTMKSGEFCPEAIARITNYVSGAFEYAQEGITVTVANQIMEIFNAKDVRYDDFMYFFADIFADKVQYGARTSLCDFMNSIQDLAFFDQLIALNDYAIEEGVSARDYSSDILQDTTIDFSKSGRQWTYQYCTEFGFFQTPSETPLRSDLIALPYWYDFCHRVFPDAHILVDITRSETEFAGFPIQATNTFFVNGGEDPWQWAGMRETPANSEQIARVAQCNDCGHCCELYTPKEGDPEELVQIREEIRLWIRDILSQDQQI